MSSKSVLFLESVAKGHFHVSNRLEELGFVVRYEWNESHVELYSTVVNCLRVDQLRYNVVVLDVRFEVTNGDFGGLWLYRKLKNEFQDRWDHLIVYSIWGQPRQFQYSRLEEFVGEQGVPRDNIIEKKNFRALVDRISYLSSVPRSE